MTEYKFSELFSWSSGKPIEITNGTIPVYGSNGIIGYTDRAKYCNRIILGRVGAYCGSVEYCDGEFNATDNTLITTCDTSKIIYQYAYYLLKLMGLNKYAGGSAQPLITQGLLKHLKCNIPGIKEQNKISELLSQYDLAIENNNKRIKILEQMAENLYKEWFVRFRFPGHEKTEFEGGIPKGWEMIKIKDITSLRSGYAFKSEWFTDEGYCVAKIKDIGSIIMDTGDFSFVSEENCIKAKKYILTEGDLTIALTGATIGKISIVPQYDNKIYTNQRLGKFFNGNNPIEKLPYLYCFFSQKEITQTILNISNSSSAQPNISPEQIEDIKFLGNIKIIDKFNVQTKCIFELILRLYYKNTNLIKQRDLLLPRLMSGKLQVK